MLVSRSEIDELVEKNMKYMRIPGKYEEYVKICKKYNMRVLTLEELRIQTYKNLGIEKEQI